MSYGLLWIQMLLACLLFAAAGVAPGLRAKSRRTYISGLVWGIIFPLLPLGMAVASGVFMRSAFGAQSNRLFWAILLVVCYAVGVAVLLKVGLRRDAAGASRATLWPKGRINLWFFGVVLLMVMTYWN